MNKTNQNTEIKELDITVRAKNVLNLLEIKTLGELHVGYILNTLPSVGTIVKHYPFARVTVIYTKKVNDEIRELLKTHFNISDKKLKNVGT
jgi:hypothetical protein